MSSHVIDAPKAATIPVVGSDKTFPVRRIYCIGRNYVAHVEEMEETPIAIRPCSSRSRQTPSSTAARRSPIPPRR